MAAAAAGLTLTEVIFHLAVVGLAAVLVLAAAVLILAAAVLVLAGAVAAAVWLL